MTTVVTEEHERRLWEELRSQIATAVPDGASETQAEDSILLAMMGADAETHDLYEQVKRLARDRAGYLGKRLEEDNPVARVRRRLYGSCA